MQLGSFSIAPKRFRIIPQPAKPCFANDISVVTISNPSNYIELERINGNFVDHISAKRPAIWATPRAENWQFIERIEHWQGTFLQMQDGAENIDQGFSLSDVNNIHVAMDFFPGDKLKWSAREHFEFSRVPYGYFSNDNLWPMRRNEFVAREVNGLLSRASLPGCRGPQCTCEGGNYDGRKCSNSGIVFWPASLL